MTTAVRSILSAAACLAASGFMAFGAQTAGAQAPGSDARMQKERATCDGVQQDRAACLREAGAARQEASRGGLTSPSPARGQVNALARCGELPAAEQPDCEARIEGGARTTTEGSVMGGGVIRETVTPLPPQTMPAR
ncbi:hypothetical protein [Variovorax sp. Root434]|uniref:hypothetical protein n=1 Tax=Variovorax sp. Root434 TaxID=1736536 RepID=UPI0006F5373C|nr:hypothetical protein [Variovorax sp. Root434]KQX22064.1 hypothetical protein ASD05_13990 [Variovorax sp. Root434]